MAGNVAGFYGKFPNIGDFVNRRLNREFLDVWDEWLQGAIASSRDKLGEKWLETYLSSPIWRFVICGGICGEAPRAGLLMPSVDRVGRYYPLVLVVDLPLDCNPLHIADTGSTWFDHAERLLLGALEEGFDMDQFDSQLQALGNLDTYTEHVRNAPGFGSQWQIPLNDQADVGSALLPLSHNLILQRLGNYSAWWGHGSHQVSPSLLVTPELPPTSSYAAMLNGEWRHSEWESWGSGSTFSNMDEF